MVDDRRQVDVVEVAVPVDLVGVEREGGPVLLVERRPQLEEAVHPEDGLGLGVHAVDLHVVERTLDLGSALLEPGRELGGPASARPGAEGPFAC